MNKIIATSLSALGIVSALFIAGPALAASATSTMHSENTMHQDEHSASTSENGAGRGIGSPMGGSKDKHMTQASIKARCLKAALTKKNAALHAAQATFKAAQKESEGVATSTEQKTAAKMAYKDAIKAAQTAFEADRKACLNK